MAATERGSLLPHGPSAMNVDFDSPYDPLPDDDEPEEWDDDAAEVIECPACGAEVYEEAVSCPVCGEYIVADTSPWTGRPLWWIVLGAAGVAATVLALTL